MVTADPFLTERAAQYLAGQSEAKSPHDIAAALGVVTGAVVAPLRLLVAEGSAQETPNRSYTATERGRRSAAEALEADMADDVQDEADAITAAFVALDPASTAAALVASMYELDPEPYHQQMAPHLDAAHRHFAEARRLDSGQFAGGPARAQRARLAALDAITAAVNIVDPTRTRNDVLRGVFRAAGPRVLAASLVAAAAARPGAVVASTRQPTPRSARAATRRSSSQVERVAARAPSATCCGTPVTDGSRPCGCEGPVRR